MSNWQAKSQATRTPGRWGAPCSTATVLSSTPDAAKATALGLDANQCFLYQSGQARIIGCNTPTDFRVILMENLAAVQ